MLFLFHLCWGSKQIVEVTFPRRRILAVAVAMCLRPIKDRFDSALNALCRFRFVGPDRFEDGEDMAYLNVAHLEFPNDGLGILRERVCPLLGVLVIAPAWGMVMDVLLRGDGKRDFSAAASE